MPTKQQLSWMLYDWASSPVPTLHATFVFSVYFTTQIMPDGGSFYWSQMVGVTALLLGISAPFLGRMADRRGWIKHSLFAGTCGGALTTALLWFAAPDISWAGFALLCSALSIFCVEISFVFYNALLPVLAPKHLTGRLSAQGWGLGYFGAIIALIIVLWLFILPETPLFFADTDEMEPVRFSMVFSALWLVIFSLPLFIFCKNPPALAQLTNSLSEHPADTGLISDTYAAFRRACQIPGMIRFLLSRMAFNDGLITLFAFGGIYAAQIFSFTQTQILVFAIGLNITAGIGAFISATLHQRYDSLQIIRISLISLIILGGICIWAPTPAIFWGAGLCLGVCIGPCQSSARVHLAQLAPPDDRASLFGLFMLSGKLTSFVGPLCYGWLVWGFGTDRAGMMIVILLLMLGLILLPAGTPQQTPEHSPD